MDGDVQNGSVMAGQIAGMVKEKLYLSGTDPEAGDRDR